MKETVLGRIIIHFIYRDESGPKNALLSLSVLTFWTEREKGVLSLPKIDKYVVRGGRAREGAVKDVT